MSKLSTKNVKTEGGGISKSIQPGNHKCKIIDIEIEEFKFKANSFHVKLYLETKPVEGTFEGFFINRADESKGRHKGQVGWVKHSEWAFADSVTTKGVEVSRDQDVLKFLKTLCLSFGNKTWVSEQDEKHDTIEDFIKAFKKDAPFKDIYLNWCICGKEYQNKQGYINYDLYLPRFVKNGVPFESEQSTPSKLIKFKEEEHVKKAKVTPVSEFGDAKDELSTDSASDFTLS
jgi:hypothetical protein